MSRVLICPNCGAPLALDSSRKAYLCQNGHCFDRAKEGYVNLTIGSRSGETRGDSRASAKARHEFLDKGYFACLKEYIAEKMEGTVLDICCGEGYYDDYLGELYGFDLSKEMVRLAAKRHREENFHYFVANLADIPVADGSIDTGIHLFAPFHEGEFARVLKPGGTLYSVIPGAEHLYEMKQIVYDTPYKNDEKTPGSTLLKLTDREKISRKVRISGEDLRTCFSMTPYYYRTAEKDRRKLDAVDALDLTVSFIVLQYQKL